MRHIETLLNRRHLFAGELTCTEEGRGSFRAAITWLDYGASLTAFAPDGTELAVTSPISLWDAITTLDEMLGRLPAGWEPRSCG